MSETTLTQTTAVDRLLACIQAGAGIDPRVFSAGACLDATVPNWRFRVEGARDIGAQLARWYASPAKLEDLRRTPLPDGELVEFTLSWEERGVPHAGHQVHVIEIDANGAICADRVWCGGRWDAALLAEMEAASHAG